jgi:PAS domain S-box-containing protein
MSERLPLREFPPDNEQLFRAFAAAMPQVAWTSVGNAEPHYFNPAWYLFTGLPSGTVGAEAWRAAIHADEVAAALTAWDTARATGASWEYELRLRRADGAYRWHHLQCVPVKNPDGSVQFRLGSATDIHEQRLARLRLEESEERLALALEASNLGTWDWDVASDTLRFDARCEQIFGMEPGSFSGSFSEDLARVIHPEDLERLRDAVKASISGRTPYRLEYRTVWPDGSLHWVHASGRAYYDKRTGQPTRMLGTVANIDEIKNQEARFRQALLEKNESLETLELVNATGQSLAAELHLERLVQGVTDAATRLSKAAFGAFFYNVLNERGEAYMLYTLSGVPKESFEKFPMPRATQVFAPTFKGEGVVRSDDITRDPRYGHNAPNKGMPQGHLPVRSYLAVPVTSRSGEVIGGLFFGHFQTGVFTEREEKLVVGLAAQVAVAMDNARLFQRAQEAISSRDTFLSIASHELRTPITSMKMQAQLMRRRIASNDPTAFSPERVTRLVDQTERSIGRLSRLVEDMLDISRIATGRLNMQLEEVELSELTREVLSRFEPQFSEAGHPLELHLTSGIVGRWDRYRLEQVLANLLTNALKYAPGAPLKVSTQQVGNAAILEVQDRGPGIAPEDQHRIFERFERLVTANQASGLGLGLHIAKHIVEAHGGTIQVRSTRGEGASFIVELPLHAPGPSEAGEVVVPQG